MREQAENDILLAPHASELRKQALLYVFEVQSRLYKINNNLKEFCQKHNISDVDLASEEIILNLKNIGLIVKSENEDSKSFSIEGSSFDVKGRIQTMTQELVSRTKDINVAYKK